MFRRLSNSLPEDPKFSADLEALGYYVNEKDQIRSIANPDQEFNYFISKNERVNDMQREAMNTCIREIVLSRLTASGLSILRLPIGTPATEPHIPILTSTNLASAKRAIVFFGEAVQDLGIFAYRIIGQKAIAAGSAIELVLALQTSINDNSVGIILANMGQLIWHRRGKRAMTHVSWQSLPRKTAVAGPMRLDMVKNCVPGNESMEAHVKYLFEEVVEKMIGKGAAIDVIGIGNDGANDVPTYLDRNWNQWKGKVQAIVLGQPQTLVKQYDNEEFVEFLGRRGRAYLLSKEPLDTPLEDGEYGCNCYSASEPLYTECIMSAALERILQFFALVDTVPGYEEIKVMLPNSAGLVAPEAEDDEDGKSVIGE